MSAEFDIMGGFVSPDVKKQFDELNKYAEQSAAKMKELAKQKDAVFGSAANNPDVNNQKVLNALEIQNMKLREAQEKSNAKLLILDQKLKNTLEQQEVQHKNKMQKITKEKIGYMYDLEREVGRLKDAFWSLTEAEQKATGGQQILANLRAKRSEFAALKASYGDNTMYVGEYSRGVNGLKQSMTMLAGEMPNFAQSFRIGMMSLSNNWMGLSQAIQIAKQEQKQYMEQFKAGLIDKKPDSLFKMITKSIFSMNLVLMVAVTLMQVYNEEIGNFLENLFSATDQANKFAKALNEVEKAASDMLVNDKQKVQEFIHDYQLAFKNGDEEMLKSLQKRGEKEFDLTKSQMDEIVKLKANAATSIFDDYLQKAEDAYFDEVIIKKKVQAQANAEISVKKAQDMFRSASDTKSVKGRIKTVGIGVESLTFETLKRAAYDKSFANELFEALSVTGVGQDIVNELKAAVAENDIIKFLPKLRGTSYISKTDKPTGTKGSKQFTEINVMREYYQSEEALIKKLADLENDITKSNEEGVLNSYEKRTKAADLYYRTVETMAMSEKFIAIQNEKEKTEAAKRSIQQKYENNVRKFGAGSAEAAKSLSELNVGNATIEANEADAILKINDAFTKKITEATKKRSKELLAINKDVYDDEVYLIEQKEKIKLLFAGQQSASIGEMALGLFGVKTDKTLEKGNKERDIKRQSLLKQLKGASGEQEKDIWRGLKELDQEDINQKELFQLQSIEDAKADIVENSIDTLKSLWDSYYAYLEEQVDKQLKKDTKINDERVKQYEDETKAGLHTADELDKYKERSIAYQTSLEEEAARKKAELEKQQFLIGQAFALGQVWINYFVAAMKNNAQLGTVLATPLNGWLLGSAFASTALIAAQTIPAFEKGGDVNESGIALVGEKRHELVYNKKTGKSFITPDKPTYMYLEKGMHVYPDAQKLDLDSFNRSTSAIPYVMQDDRLLDEVKQLNRNFRNQKAPQINGMRLLQQLQYAEKNVRSGRSLIN